MDKHSGSAESIFARASELSPGAAREQFLMEKCGADAGLREEVESLLRASDQAGDFLRPASERIKARWS
jgi:hypothetical protein